MRIIPFLLGALVVASAQVSAADEYTPLDDYQQTIEQWRENRDAGLRKPDGWFSYAGAGIVNLGRSTIGSASDNTIVLPKGPARIGTLTVNKAGTARFRVERGSGVLIDGKPARGKVILKDNADGATPTRVSIGDAWFYLVHMGDVIGWRFRDPDSPALKAFSGIEYFPIDPSWRIEADWQPFEPAHEIELVTIINTLEKAPVPGKATFERNGQQFNLQPVLEDDGRLLFIFADQTSGKETYGAGRMVYAQPAKDGKVVIDFNKAFNPPCSLSPHVVCPTAPPENRLRLRVDAGEKTYRGATR
ncbi:MAG TPA: DUF1684 domain-containing protein [Dokdonella sp.]|nr:DUF1684 domain-containing protein [Dokdonella sp.]